MRKLYGAVAVGAALVLGFVARGVVPVEPIAHAQSARIFELRTYTAPDGKLADLHARWGAALFHDPGYNPHWTRDGHPFDGYRYPSRDGILRHIDRAARALPWLPITDADAPYWG